MTPGDIFTTVRNESGQVWVWTDKVDAKTNKLMQLFITRVSIPMQDWDEYTLEKYRRFIVLGNITELVGMLVDTLFKE